MDIWMKFLKTMSNWGKKPLTISTFNPVLKIGRTELGGLDDHGCCIFSSLSAYGGCIEIECWSLECQGCGRHVDNLTSHETCTSPFSSTRGEISMLEIYGPNPAGNNGGHDSTLYWFSDFLLHQKPQQGVVLLLEKRERTGLLSSMVFRTVPETESNTNNNTAMASSTSTTTNVKPHQPLHNFPLQDLKWSKNHSNNVTNHHHRFRTHKSPHRDVASAADSDGDGGVKIKKLLKIKSGDVDNSERKSKIFIRLRTNKNSSGSGSSSGSSKCMVDDVAGGAVDQDSAAVVEDAEELMPKTWNLRPRRAVNNINNDSNSNNKGLNGNGGALKIGGGAVPEIKPQVPGVENVVLLLCRVRESTEKFETDCGKRVAHSFKSSSYARAVDWLFIAVFNGKLDAVISGWKIKHGDGHPSEVHGLPY
ncbi:hypothetical protein SADUNF_Sadunf14G0027900 [Salix dunnii]|uniref:Uncharacterized protein n=1 Tax=Salix dunnii TaxID=1413687 RepID=A0A835JG07_9ROSI|nr:hypothetical protein SADUNF_Sadunf14G0027900 [Salix dunnii]